MRDFLRGTAWSPLLIGITYIGLHLITGVSIAFLLYLLPEISPFLLFVPVILLFAWFGGFLAGFMTTIMSVITLLCYFFVPTPKPLLIISASNFFDITALLLVGLFASYMIDKAKKQEIIDTLQDRIHQKDERLHKLESNFALAKKEIEARDQFLAIASHELKTPVTSMLLQVQSAIHNIRNVSLANFSVENLLKMLEGTEQQSKRLSKMVNDLLNLSLITTGKMDLEPEKTDLSNIVQEVADNFSEKVKKEHTTLTVESNQPIICLCDKVRIAQAITNLISNALKYGGGKPIHIALQHTATHAKILVNDQGIGIPSDQQKRIFERFERAVSSKEYKGLGVGLYITNQIIKAHHGTITLQSKPNKGTTFVIEIPKNV